VHLIARFKNWGFRRDIGSKPGDVRAYGEIPEPQFPLILERDNFLFKRDDVIRFF
jgi:hypothetical protein